VFCVLFGGYSLVLVNMFVVRGVFPCVCGVYVVRGVFPCVGDVFVVRGVFPSLQKHTPIAPAFSPAFSGRKARFARLQPSKSLAISGSLLGSKAQYSTRMGLSENFKAALSELKAKITSVPESDVNNTVYFSCESDADRAWGFRPSSAVESEGE
jgi:hypothetical protein